MSPPTDIDEQMEDDYDEEADSDFDAASAGAGEASSSSDEDELRGEESPERPKKRRKIEKPTVPQITELDSGDEATIKEQEKTRRKQRRKGDVVDEDDGEESDGWRARTRAMRERDKEKQKVNKLASMQGSTIDVDKLWEEMNRAGPLPPPQLAITRAENETKPIGHDAISAPPGLLENGNKENIPSHNEEELITIRRTYKFAGEVHTEEKVVSKSSAEARLWQSQQASKPQTVGPEGKTTHRPLRKISRFDPNYTNLEAFKRSWSTASGGRKGPTGPKLNVVEKSKMDWAVHVDTEGLKEELDEHAKAKEGYLNRMDFLGEVEQRKEAEARAARLRGQ